MTVAFRFSLNRRDSARVSQTGAKKLETVGYGALFGRFRSQRQTNCLQSSRSLPIELRRHPHRRLPQARFLSGSESTCASLWTYLKERPRFSANSLHWKPSVRLLAIVTHSVGSCAPPTSGTAGWRGRCGRAAVGQISLLLMGLVAQPDVDYEQRTVRW